MRMQTVVIITTSAIVAISSLGCCMVGWSGARGSGRVVEKEFAVKDFTGVELATFGNLTIEVGDKEELRVEAEDNLIRYFEADVFGDTLKIDSRPGINIRPTRRVHFYLTVKELDTLIVTGSGDVEALDLKAERFSARITGSGDVEMRSLEADEVEVRITGSGDLDISSVEAKRQEITMTGSGDMEIGDLDTDEIEARITGSGNLDIRDGRAEEQRVTLSGSGSYGARRLESDEADVRIGGSGGVTVHVRERMEVKITGSGDVHYAGSPRVEQSVTGSGDVVRMGR
jgi:hypothetical protein